MTDVIDKPTTSPISTTANPNRIDPPMDVIPRAA